MKFTLSKVNRKTMSVYFATLVLISGIVSCNKFDDIFDHHNPGKGDKPTSYSSEVIEKWAAMQCRLLKVAAGPNHGFGRHYAYTGIAAWESIAPGMPGFAQIKDQYNGLTGLPQAYNNKKYYWPANANAALAEINRAFFPNASAVDKAAIDSLENALNNQFLSKTTATALDNSKQFGKQVAAAVFAWAETDGFKNANAPYTAPVGAGLWKPTAPGQLPATPYWGNNRPILKGSLNGTTPPAPPAYSTQPGSAFYNMVKEVYDVSKVNTPDQVNMALFWRDVPGATTPGHWINILNKVIDKKNVSLAKAALAYALTGSALNDASIAVFKVKYQYNLVRPVTYIREVIGDTAWIPTLVGTPAHPEYISAHSSLSMAVAGVLQGIFGNSGTFVDNTYDYLGFPARTFNSFEAIAIEAGKSRLHGGIHYTYSIDKGLLQGKKVASNILDRCPSFGF